jgi:hypothetical protein
LLRSQLVTKHRPIHRAESQRLGMALGQHISRLGGKTGLPESGSTWAGF